MTVPELFDLMHRIMEEVELRFMQDVDAGRITEEEYKEITGVKSWETLNVQ